ncbi:MAG: hypothetical protein NTW66_02870 [Candidatus Magasanikbacteria bacterium]|nr:hypothetical protein [Candidatus Magasanikbacteria bacterium]
MRRTKQKTHKASVQVDNPPLFIGFIMEEKAFSFDVYLINNSNWKYKSVTIFTGAFMTVDDDLLETSKVVKVKGPLGAYSSIKIDRSDWNELDFVIWYHLDLVRADDTVEKYWFCLPKGGGDYDNKVIKLPIINRKGMSIELEARNGECIAEETKTIEMKSKYHKFSKEY